MSVSGGVRFPKAQLSPAVPGNNQVRFLSFRGRALEHRGDVVLWIPPGMEAEHDVPVLLLLHGVYGCQWNWWLNGGVDQTAYEMLSSGAMRPMLIAMPSDGLWGDGSGYVPHAQADYGRWIVEDVLGCVRELFPQTRRDEFRIAGLSMGGFGAMRLGCKYAAQVEAISAHSSVTHVSQLPRFIPYAEADFQHAGEEETSLLYWAEKNRAHLPRWRFDCGIDDPLIEENRTLHRELEKSGIPHIYEEYVGAHDWDYWTEHVRRTLAFCSEP